MRRGAVLVKRKRKAGKHSATASAPPPADSFSNSSPPAGEDSQIQSSGFSLHELFAQQAMKMLDRTDLDDEQKQSILVAMSCPCCGAGGLSFTAKLKRK